MRFDAPLMSFGGVMVDNIGPSDRFPGQSMVAGLLGNALGYSHADSMRLEALQARLEIAARWDVPPVPIVDYQTVELGQPKMRRPGWTTRGVAEHREGGAAAAFGIHQRYRHYLANGVLTLVVALDGLPEPSLDSIQHALRRPARPLYIGRKTCLPAAPVLLGVLESRDILAALRSVPPSPRAPATTPLEMEACWPVSLGEVARSTRVTVYCRRDWRNQVHTGATDRYEGLIEVTP